MTEHDAIEQLAALLDGEDVPDAPSSLGALADLATAVHDHADLMAPTAEFRTSLRAELVAAAAAPPGLVERARTAWANRTAQLRTSARVAVATMTASSLIGSAGVAVAAQQALPGEFLYELKSLTEDARMVLAVDGVAEARLHLAFARERLEELRATTGQLDSDQVAALLAEMDAHSEAGASVLLDGVAFGTADTAEVRRFTAQQRDGLVSMLNDLPLLAWPVAEDSLALLRRLEAIASDVTPRDSSDDATSEQEDGLLDDVEEAAARDAHRDLPLSETVIDDADVELPSLDDGPELSLEELYDSGESRESTTTSDETAQGDSEQASESEPESEQDAEQEPEPLDPTDGLVAPETDTGDDDDNDADRSLDSPTSMERLPVEDITEAVEDAVSADVVSDAV